MVIMRLQGGLSIPPVNRESLTLSGPIYKNTGLTKLLSFLLYLLTLTTENFIVFEGWNLARQVVDILYTLCTHFVDSLWTPRGRRLFMLRRPRM